MAGAKCPRMGRLGPTSLGTTFLLHVASLQGIFLLGRTRAVPMDRVAHGKV